MTYHEESMVGASTDDPDFDSVFGIPLGSFELEWGMRGRARNR